MWPENCRYCGVTHERKALISGSLAEYGVAHLKGQSVRELTRIAIAHPKFRESLALEAKKLGVL